ncbi:MAG TPA: matrixin family metalloprotease, partial [Pirellulaceae bacterium]
MVRQVVCFGFIRVLFLLLAFLTSIADVSAYFLENRWELTASGGTGTQGSPMTLTWGFVPDGTPIPDPGFGGGTSSDLIAALDQSFGAGGGGADLTQRPWFEYFDRVFSRWAELGGGTYVYEPADDGAEVAGLEGSLGVRGDVRISGNVIDGASGILAYNYLPNNGDMVIDTGDMGFYSNNANDYLRLRNVLAHEHGHGFGL